jgi:hypothetical protein
MLQIPDRDPFGPIVALMMFEQFPACVVEMTEQEEAKLKEGGFIL